MAKLTREQIVTIEVLQARGQSQCQTARILGVSEGAVRYHLRRAREGAADGRQKPSHIEQLRLTEAVARWWQAQVEILGKERPPSVQLLHEFLRAEYGYNGSYKSVRKFVRAHYGRPPIRPFRRVETPPGAQTQSDWGEFRQIDLGDVAVKTDSGSQQVDRTASTLLGVGVREAVRDSGRGGGEVPRTELDDLLHSWSIDHVVICGYASECCVDTTVRRAAALGYGVTVAADAHTTHDQPHATGAQIRIHENAVLPGLTSFGPTIRAIASADIAFA